MPISEYFHGHGEEIAANMKKEYGSSWKPYFYGLANKKGLKPAQDGDLANPPQEDDLEDGIPMPTPPRQVSQMSPFDSAPAAMTAAVPPTPPSPGGPIGPPTPPPPSGMPVLNTGESMDIDPRFLKKPGPAPDYGQSPELKSAREDYVKASAKKTPIWKEAIAAALSATPRGRGAASILLQPPGAKEERKMLALEAVAEGERKAQTAAENTELNKLRAESLKTERESLAESRASNADTRAANQQINAQKLKEVQDKDARSALILHMGGEKSERFLDAHYQKATDPLLPGWDFYANPSEPGWGYAAPPALSKPTPDLMPYLKGVPEGQMITHSQYKAAVALANQIALESAKAENRQGRNPTESSLELDAQNPDPKISGPAKAALDLHQKNAIAKAQAGASKPVTMVVPDGKGGQVLASIPVGQTVPQGAVTPSGASQANVPTSNTRTMAEKAPRVIDFVDRASKLLDENEKQLGPLSSRWNEFTAGRVGIPNKGYTQLRTDMGLLETALMNMHTGARGSAEMMKHFHDLINLGIQDPENLRAALGEIRDYAQRISQEGGIKGTTLPAQNGLSEVSTQDLLKRLANGQR